MNFVKNKFLKYFIAIPTILIVGCADEEAPEVQLNFCSKEDVFLSVDDNREAVRERDSLVVCGRTQAELDAKIKLLDDKFQEEFQAALIEFDELQRNKPIVLVTMDEEQESLKTGVYQDGSEFEFLKNPFLDGDNKEENTVVKFTRSGSSVPFDGIFFTLPTKADFTSDKKKVTILVYSSKNVDLELQFQDGENGALKFFKKVSVNDSGWQSIEVNFSSGALISFGEPGQFEPIVPNGIYNAIQFQFDPGNVGSEVYYIDQVTIENPASTTDTSNDNATDLITMDEEGLTTGVYPEASLVEFVDNPFISGANQEESKVLKFTRAGTQDFEGVIVDLIEPADFSGDNKKINILIYSDKAVVAEVQFRNADDAVGNVFKAINLTNEGWQSFEIDYSEGAKLAFNGQANQGADFVPDGNYKTLQVQFDGGNTAPGVYYIDTVKKLQ